jgi:hypothetical protein
MVQLGEMEGGDIRCQKSKEQEGLLPKRIKKKTKRGSMKAQENKGGLINGKGHARSQGGPLVKRKGYRTKKGKWVNTTMKGKEKRGEEVIYHKEGGIQLVNIGFNTQGETKRMN